MNKKNSFTLFGLFFLLVFSVSCLGSDEPIGKWSDNIKLSQKEVSVSAESQTVLISTEGEWWWLNAVSLNDDIYADFSGIDTTRENFVIEKNDFRIERKHATEIIIEMSENSDGPERVLTIGLQAGNYFDSIQITQAGS